jgi:hypothetical protein
MTNSSQILLERIDHGVLPSNDLGRAFRFWSGFMGGQIGHHTNFNTRGLNREVPMIIFMTVANHRGFGLALQDFRISPNPARPLDGIVWGFEVAADNLEYEKAALLRDRPLNSVVHSCGSGVTACHNRFAMELAGLTESRVYPGSWSEWVRDEGRPVETSV